MTEGGGPAAAFDATTSQASSAGAGLGAVGTPVAGYGNTVGVDWGSGVTKTIIQFKLWAPNNTAINGGAGGTSIKLQGSNDNSTWTDLYTSGTVLASASSTLDISSGISAGAYRYHRIAANGNGVNGIYLAEVQFYEAGSTSNMTLVTTTQNADATVSNGRVLMEIDNTATPALNTDLTVEVTCDGGSHWTGASLTSVGLGQGGRLVVETADQATTGGTSFAARIKTFNNKLIPIYGVSVTVH